MNCASQTRRSIGAVTTAIRKLKVILGEHSAPTAHKGHFVTGRGRGPCWLCHRGCRQSKPNLAAGESCTGSDAANRASASRDTCIARNTQAVSHACWRVTWPGAGQHAGAHVLHVPSRHMQNGHVHRRGMPSYSSSACCRQRARRAAVVAPSPAAGESCAARNASRRPVAES